MALVEQVLRVRLVHVLALGLAVGAERAADIRAFVVSEARLPHALVDQVDCAGDLALLIRILDAEDELAAVLLGQQIGIQRRAQPSKVQIACRAGGKACTNFLIHG